MSYTPRIRESGLSELSRRVLWPGLVLGLLLRVLAWVLLGDKLPLHGFESGVISDNIAAGRGYFMPFYYTDIPIHSFIPPFYPTLMALFKMLGVDHVFWLRILQILASLSNALLAASLAGRWFGRRAMHWSFLLVAFYPLFAIYSLAIFSTTFIMTWVLILMNIMDRVDGPRPLLLGALTGLLHGLAVLTSPPLGLLGLLFLFRLWRFRNPGRLRRTFSYLVVLALVWSPWIIRNHAVHGQLLLTSTNGGFNFLVGNNPHAGGYTWGEFTEEEHFWTVVDREMVETLPEPQLEMWFYGRALEYIRAEPLHYLGFFFRKVYYFWWCRDVARFGYPSPWSVAYQAVYACFLPFILAGIWFWRRRWRRLFPAFFLFAEYTVLYGAYFVRSRFRWEIEPLLLVFAVAGWFEILRRLRGRNRWERSMIHPILWAALASGLAAQIYKVVVESLRERRLKLYRFFETGGMPSSHTAVVTALTVGAWRESGFDSALFAITLIFSLYFVLEATGLRQEVGKQARVLNEIIDELIDTRHFAREKTRELLGHTWSEVLGGFALGLVLTLIILR